MTFFLSSKSLNYPKQDVRDCLTAIDHVINEKLIDASKVAVVGISHGGFLTTHLIGQVGILIDFRVIAVALSVLVPSIILQFGCRLQTDLSWELLGILCATWR